ncbi:ARM repeat-containing protein [Xylaria venustula]|nr:ARM repeat-containing protein [Xylaria venustula]
MKSIKVGHVVFVAGGAIALYILLRRLARFRSSSRPASDDPRRPRQTKGVRLHQVYPLADSKTVTDVDVIAIHGLDTDSPRTWTWEHEDPKLANVNWLEDPNMLPERIPTARIFTCNWPADLFGRPDLTTKMIDEFARLLLAGIKNRPPVMSQGDGRDNRPVIFIASCLGGVVLMKALVMATGEYATVGQVTRGIIFLATPFRGTSFQDVAEWAEPGLRAWALIRNKNVSNLLQHVKSSFELGELVRTFTTFCQTHDLSDFVFTFYETGKTSLPRKIVPWMPALLSQKQPLVNQHSATLDFVPHPLPLDRTHLLMNKFQGPDDPGYSSVAGTIEALLHRVRHGRPVETANLWIRNKRYSLENLEIERLSGDRLPMGRCYINLAIIKQPSDKADPAREENMMKQYSPFSLSSRLYVESPRKDLEVTLPTLFEPREINGSLKTPSRILIHGRAGVGKTTLCKKIIYEFTYGTLWQDRFDWVLWVPLRNLKLEERRRSPEYNFRDLFRHEYFYQHPEGDKLADALWHALIQTKGARFLFLLDGLDEVSRDLEGNMLRFLTELLNQLNVIITARPNATLPSNIEPLQLKLDTIGFYSDQVDAYIENAFTNTETGKFDSRKMEEVQKFLNRHRLIHSLVRIPIQLDVLCYTWDEYRGEGPNEQDAQETMTAIYQRMEQLLWRKDAENLEKWTRSQIQDARDEDIRMSTDDELRILELLAFYGMYNDVIDFEPKHRDMISRHVNHHDRKFLLDTMLGRVSFLRSSNSSSKAHKRNYHFLHLTFQEYFAARYFVRQWKAQKQLKCLGSQDEEDTESCPVVFLHRNKYSVRYDIFWRFVAGLLTAEQDSKIFFQTIEEEPRDLLGAAHQRLVAHCLGETSMRVSHRGNIEDQLVQWLLFEVDFYKSSALARETDLPVNVIEKAMRRDHRTTETLMKSLGPMTEELARLVSRYIEDENLAIRCSALRALEGQPAVKHYIQTIMASLKSDDYDLSYSALKALEGQPIAQEHIWDIIHRLGDESFNVSSTAAQMLQGQTFLKEHFQAIVAYIRNDHRWSKNPALRALEGQPVPQEHIWAIIQCLGDDSASYEAAQRLQKQTLLKEHFQAIIEYLKIDQGRSRNSALEALDGQPVPQEHIQAIIQCLEADSPFDKDIAAKVLRGQLATSDHFQSISAYLQHRNPYVKLKALEVLGSQPVPKEYRQAIIICLEDSEPRVRQAAVETLQNWPVDEYFQSIKSYLGDRRWEVRGAALLALKGQPIISEDYSHVIVTGLKDKNGHVKSNALDVLRRLATLPQELLQAVALSLEDDDAGIRIKALEVLKNQSTLPPELLAAVALNLKHNNTYVREMALSVLASKQNLPEELYPVIVAYLNSDDLDDTLGALETLKVHQNWPEEILQWIVASLDGAYSVRFVAIQAIITQRIVSRQILQSIAARLEHCDDHATVEAAKLLCSQADLSLIPIEGVGSFYRAILRLERDADRRTVIWQDVDNVSHITIGSETYSSVWPDGFRDKIREIQQEIGIPPKETINRDRIGPGSGSTMQTSIYDTNTEFIYLMPAP